MIYCVEDDINIQELVVYTLNSTGYKAKGAKNASELHLLITQEIPELILLDI